MQTNITRLIAGLAIITVGVALLLANFDLFNFKQVVHDWWPSVIILAGALVLVNNSRSYIWALLIMGFGAILQLRQLGIADVNPWQLFWPVVIIAVGLSVLFNRAAVRPKLSKAEREDAMAVLGGSDIRSTSADFKGSKASAIMGGVKLDLRKATIKKEATIEVFAFWGGIELLVPKGVLVKNKTGVIMGGVEDKTEQENTKDAPVLYVVGDVIMAGVDIKN